MNVKFLQLHGNFGKTVVEVAAKHNPETVEDENGFSLCWKQRIKTFTVRLKPLFKIPQSCN